MAPVKALNFMQLKKHLIAQGVPKDEVNRQDGKPSLLRLALDEYGTGSAVLEVDLQPA